MRHLRAPPSRVPRARGRAGRAVTAVENPPDANVVDVADPATAELLTLPPVRELFVGKRRVHDSILRSPRSPRQELRVVPGKGRGRRRGAPCSVLAATAR